jgi:hypothetical protein
MAKQTNFTTSVDVRTVVEWTVDRTMYWNVAGTTRTTVYRTVRVDVYETVDNAVHWTVRDVVHQAKNKHPNHPGLQDFLLEVGVRSDD